MLSCERAGLGLLLDDVFLSAAPRLPKLDLGVETAGLPAVALAFLAAASAFTCEGVFLVGVLLVGPTL